MKLPGTAEEFLFMKTRSAGVHESREECRSGVYYFVEAADVDHGRDAQGRQFPETHWSQLLELGDPANPHYVDNLNRLIHQYWRPVYYFVRSLRPVATPEAEDLTQQFFTMLLDRSAFTKLAPERGSFRGFLKTALRYFLIDQD